MARFDPDLPIARALVALHDPQMRLRRAARFLTDADAAEVVAAIERAARGAQDADARVVHLSILHLLLHVRPRPVLPGGPLPLPDRQWLLSELRVAELIGAAARARHRFAARLLRDAFAPPVTADARLLNLHPTLEVLPLGVRRERARQHRRELLGDLLVDTTPAVVQLLAENPRVVQAHAMQIATLRPTHPYALQALLMTHRWLADDRVCEAVVRNPSAPGWLVLGLAPLLPRRVQAALMHLNWIERELRELLATTLDLAAPAPAAPVDEPGAPVVHIVHADGLGEESEG